MSCVWEAGWHRKAGQELEAAMGGGLRIRLYDVEAEPCDTGVGMGHASATHQQQPGLVCAVCEAPGFDRDDLHVRSEPRSRPTLWLSDMALHGPSAQHGRAGCMTASKHAGLKAVDNGSRHAP
jgi:hypothetical protein